MHNLIHGVKRGEVIRHTIHLIEQSMPLCLHGAPGVGKTELIQDVAKAMNYKCRIIHLNQKGPEDVKGHTVPDMAARLAVQFPPADLPREDARRNEAREPPTIVFLDEWGTAPENLRKPALELIQARRIGAYELAERHRVVLATNLGTDGVMHEEMDPATSDRMCHLLVEPDLEHWRRHYAPGAGIDERILSFLGAHEEAFHYMPKPGTTGHTIPNELVRPTPRAWTNLSKVIRGRDLADVEPLIVGYVGRDTAKRFLLYAENAADEASIQELMEMTPAKRTKNMPQTQARILSVTMALPRIVADGGETGLAACHTAYLIGKTASRNMKGAALSAELAEITLDRMAERLLAPKGAGEIPPEEAAERIRKGPINGALANEYEEFADHELFPHYIACVARLGPEWLPKASGRKDVAAAYRKTRKESLDQLRERHALGPKLDPILAARATQQPEVRNE